MSALRVQDLMSDRVYTVRPDDDMATVRDLMDDHELRHVPVVDEEENLVGLVSQRDLLRAALVDQEDLPAVVERARLERTRVREVMTRYVETVAPDADLAAAARTLYESKYGSLPVTENGRIVGILTEADFVRHFAAAG